MQFQKKRAAAILIRYWRLRNDLKSKGININYPKGMFNPYRGMNSVSNWAYMHYYPQQLFEMQNLPTSKSLCSFTVPFPSFQFLQSYQFGQLPTTFAAASNIKPHPVSSSEVSYSAEEVSKFASIENKEKKQSEIIILQQEDADDDINGNAKSKFITIGEGKPVRRQDQTTWISELRRHRISKRREQELAKIYEKLNNPRRDLEEYLQK